MRTEHISHISNDGLISLLYQAAPESEFAATSAHLATCADCQRRLQAMKARHGAECSSMIDSPSVENALLARQRAAIYSRLDSRPVSLGSRWLWAGAPLAVAAALLMMVNTGSVQQQPVKSEQTVSVAADSETLYADIYQSLSLDAPAGVQTVAGMFETTAAKTQQ